MKTTFIALAISGAVLAGSPAAAEEITISYHDLDLTTSKDQKILKRRIDAAARKVCAFDQPTTGTRLRSSDSVRCYAEAKAAAKERFAAIVAEQQLGG